MVSRWLRALWTVTAMLLATRCWARDIAPDAWISVQSGQFTGNSTTTYGRDVSQHQIGARLLATIPGDAWDVRYDLGFLKAPAGYLLDPEFDATGSIKAGNAEWHPLLVVGIPLGLMGDPYHFSGFDVTLGAGVVAEVPAGSGWLEARGQAAFNFLSYIAKLNGDPYDSNPNLHARGALLLYRVSGAAWIPVGRHMMRVELRRDDFNSWWMNAVAIGVAL